MGGGKNPGENGGDFAKIERGVIQAVSSGLYTVASFSRDGLITPGIPALPGTGGPYTVNEKVYFFLFGDGSGLVLGRFT